MSYEINNTEFNRLRGLLRDIAGIALSDAKKILLTGRLAKQLSALGLENYTQYFKYVTDVAHADELEKMVDLLTTNETYFFREPQHFDFLKEIVPPAIKPGKKFRVWSAAASTGAEAYTLAMILADKLGENGAWEVLGTDINNPVLDKARSGHYLLAEADRIPIEYLKKYCLKGNGEQKGTFLIDKKLRQHVSFEQLNLNAEGVSKVGNFDVIFLRNVLIYFDMPTKRRVIANLITCLKTGGVLIVGHSESLKGITDVLTMVKPTVYMKQ